MFYAAKRDGQPVNWVGEKLFINYELTPSKPAWIADCKFDIIQCALNTNSLHLLKPTVVTH